ncbi:MAG: tail fiber domain-containing protein, partial [Limisphaerales bacterium]
NTGIGDQAGSGIATGYLNTAVGYQAYGSGDGQYNTAVGNNAASVTNNASATTYVGDHAGYQHYGDGNTGVGAQALYGTQTTGVYNTALGYAAGYDITTGGHNIFIGDYITSGVGITSGSNNILIGQDVRPPSRTANNQLNIGNLIYATGLAKGTTASTGYVGIGTSTPQALLDLATTTSGQSAIIIPRDTAANRPAGNATNGMLRYNTNSNKFEAYENGGWTNMIGTGSTSFPLLASPTGTAGAPAYSFTGSATTGMYSASANNLAFATNGAARLTIDQMGNVGIGTAAPQGTFDVEGGTAPAGVDGKNIIIAAQSGGTGSSTLGGNVLINPGTSPNTGPGNLIIGNFGNLGIGSGSGVVWNIGSSGPSIYGQAVPNSLLMQASGGNDLFIATSGNIGVGTNVPKARLDVSATGTNSAILIPRDTTANRPAGNATNGMIRYNSSTFRFEAYETGTWTNLIGSGGGDFYKNGSVAMTGALPMGGNTLYGNSTSGGNLVLDSTSNATKGSVVLLPNTISSLIGVGIGTSTINNILEISQNWSNNAATIHLYNADTGSNASANLKLEANIGDAMTQYGSGGAGLWWIQGVDHNDGKFKFVTTTGGPSLQAATPTMTLDKTGKVGIGTATPQALLDIQATQSGMSAILIPRDTAANRPPTGVNGMIRYNTSTSKFEAFENNAWTNIINAGATSFPLLASPIGTAGAPAYSFTANSNTGMYSPSANNIAFATGGTARLSIDQMGNVGIGTTTPTTQLYVSGPKSGVISTDSYDAYPNKYSGLNFNLAGAYSGAIYATDYGGGAGHVEINAVQSIQLSPQVNVYDSGGQYACGGTNLFNVLDNQCNSMITATNGGFFGVGSAASTPAGPLDVQGGTAAAGNGKPINLYAQSGKQTGNTNGGNVVIMPGLGKGTGAWGKVGIGTATPQALLDIQATQSGMSAILIPRDTAANRPPTGVNGMIRYNTNVAAFEGFANGAWGSLASGGSSQWTTSGSNVYYNLGNVGIGTTNPTSLLHLAMETSGSSQMRFDTFSGVSNSSFVGRRAQGTMASPTAVLADDALSLYGGTGYGATGWASSTQAAVKFLAAENWSDSAQGTYITLNTTPTGSTTRAEVMRITSAGNVGIGTTTPGYPLDVVGNVRATSFISTSDRRLKTDIQTIAGLDLILKMRGVRYNWKANGQPDFGVVAQEMEEVLPEAVVTDATGYKAVKYSNLIAPLIESTKDLYGMCNASAEQLQNLQAALRDHGRRISSVEIENAELKSRMQKLEYENKTLKDRLDAIERKLGIH